VSEQRPKETETVSKTYDIFSFQAPERKDESTEAGIGTGTGVRIGTEAGGGKSSRPPPDSEKTSKAINDRKPKFRKISADKGKGEYHRSVAVHSLGDVM
jgi:hypothetical protein